MTADFTARTVPPPGGSGPPAIAVECPEPAWWSPALDSKSRHALVGGRTVWVEQGDPPRALVIAHPNRFGGGEDLARLVSLCERYRVPGWVIVDPLLLALVDLPGGLTNATSWPDGGDLVTAGERALQGADALRRRLAQVPGLRWPVSRPAGRTVTCLAPSPGDGIKEKLAAVGVLIEAPPGWWDGIITLTVGWWHTRSQLDAVAAALEEVLAERHPGPVADDRFEVIPNDLPRRKLNRIREHLRGAS